jgi:glutamate racemase
MGTMKDSKSIEKIGVFDSGLGGLTVLKELLRTHPRRSYVYFGDTAHVPYGNREADDVISLVSEISRHLVGEGCQALVVACNTSSALALSALRTAVEVPVLGVVEPASAEAAQLTRVGKIAVMATPLTAKSGVYAERIRIAAQRLGVGRQCEVVEIGCPELVPIVEEGDLESAESRRVLENYANILLRHGVDTVIMGCTHYPLLLPVLKPLLGEGIQVVDPAALIPRTLGEWYFPAGVEREGEVVFQVSGEPSNFDQRAARFLGREVKSEQVILRRPEPATLAISERPEVANA